MPRKAKNNLASVPNIPPSELMHRVAKELANMPPAAYGLAIKTGDQAVLWREAKHFYKCVACILDSYMSGEKKPDYSGMNKERREAIENEAWSHLSLYSLIFFNWEAIAPHFKDVGAPEMPAISGDTLPIRAKEFSNLGSPMETFLEAAKHRAVGHLHYAFAEQRTEFIPYQIRKEIESRKTARNANTKKHVAAQIQADRLKRYEDRQWRLLEDLCLVLADKSKPSKGSAARQALDSYRQAARADEVFWAKQMHKQKKPQRIIWENGYQIS